MNRREIAISIITTMVVITIFASTAAAQVIVVDGNGSDWDPSWFLAEDIVDAEDYGAAGYNLTDVWQYYNATNDTLYFRYDVVGIAGDSDGNGNPNTPDDGINDLYGVGGQEVYRVQLNTSHEGNASAYYDIALVYSGNAVSVGGDLANYTNGSAAISLTSPFTNVIEFSLDNVSGWLPNPYKYSLFGWVGSGMDGPGEDTLDETIRITTPPEANFTFSAGDCNLTVLFDPSESYDPDGNLTDYDWYIDLEPDGTPDLHWHYTDNTSFTHTFAYGIVSIDVNLTVTDDDNSTDSLVKTVMINSDPTVNGVTANKSCADGEWVQFAVTGSEPDSDGLVYTWTVTNGTVTDFVIGSGTFPSAPTFSGTVDYFADNQTTVTLTVEDPHNCTANGSKSLGPCGDKCDPHADANGPYKTCVGYSIIFDASGSWCDNCSIPDCIDWYEWDYYNNGTYIKTSEPIHEYTYPGEYRGLVRLRVTVDACNNTDTDTAFVIVEPCDPAAVPVMTPLGVLALIGMLCIAGVGRVMKRSRRF